MFDHSVDADGSVRAVLCHDAEQQTPDLRGEHDLKDTRVLLPLLFLSCRAGVHNRDFLRTLRGREYEEELNKAHGPNSHDDVGQEWICANLSLVEELEQSHVV